MADGANDTWAGTVRSVCLRTISTGKFGQLGFFAILGLMIWRIESQHWVKIFELAINSWAFSLLGWVLWVATVLAGIPLFAMMRSRYLAEINRLVESRNGYQALLSNGSFQSSKLENDK